MPPSVRIMSLEPSFTTQAARRGRTRRLRRNPLWSRKGLRSGVRIKG